MNSPTHSDFVGLEDRVKETIEKKIDRFEDKLDEVARCVARLMIFEERQARHSERADDLARQLHEHRNGLRQIELDLHNVRRELHGYIQRYTGASVAVSIIGGGVFAFGLRLVN